MIRACIVYGIAIISLTVAYLVIYQILTIIVSINKYKSYTYKPNRIQLQRSEILANLTAYNDALLESFRFIDPSCNNKPVVYYISNGEGIAAKLRQYAYIYSYAQSFSSCVKVFAYRSPRHFETKNINMCLYFKMPSFVSCIPQNFRNYTPNTLRCEINKNHTSKTQLLSEISYNAVDLRIQNLSYKYPKKQEISSCITYGSTDLMNFRENFENNDKFIYEVLGNTSELFSNTMEQRYSLLQDLIGVTGNSISVAHWRRGDQMYSRCHKFDFSVNCDKTETGIILQYNKFLEKFCPMLSNGTKYIATNEKNTSILEQLHTQRFQSLYSVMRSSDNFTRMTDEIEGYILEIMLMCRAKCLFLFGESSLNSYLKYCRRIYEREYDSQLITILDNKLHV